MSRENILIKTSWISTIGNAILSASKIFIGLWAGSLAVVGDGIDSATDVVISIVMILRHASSTVLLQRNMYSVMRKRKASRQRFCHWWYFMPVCKCWYLPFKASFRWSERDTIGYRYLCDYILYCRQTDAGFVPVQTGKENRQFHADGECDKYA